jgi:outer membrane protein OmpA-like peptidoglycan-associated protein
MKTPILLLLAALFLGTATALPAFWVKQSGDRMVALAATPAPPTAAVAEAANAAYCTPELKAVLRRVLQSCGLLEAGGVRGCQPADARQVASLAGDDFNALFMPMAQRAGVIQFEQNEGTLDAADQALVDRIFADQQGASYFFVVSRSSPEGSVRYNRELSEARANAVLAHLRANYQDPDLDREVGLLWLGEEFAQLDEQFCSWQRSGAEGECRTSDLNRSAFIAWIDCQL